MNLLRHSSLTYLKIRIAPHFLNIHHIRSAQLILAQIRDPNIMFRIKSIVNKIKALLPKSLSSKLPREIGVVLLKPDESARLNLIYRNKNKATNILSFYYGPNYGEILICSEIVKKEAKEQDNLPPHLKSVYNLFCDNKNIGSKLSLRGKEVYNRCGGEQVFQMTWMIAHGMLHLAGLHHESSGKDLVKFERLEKELLASFG